MLCCVCTIGEISVHFLIQQEVRVNLPTSVEFLSWTLVPGTSDPNRRFTLTSCSGDNIQIVGDLIMSSPVIVVTSTHIEG